LNKAVKDLKAIEAVEAGNKIPVCLYSLLCL
jgi:hypothetical protein